MLKLLQLVLSEGIQHEAGVRYSELLRLPYFDIVRFHLVDPMHNLFWEQMDAHNLKAKRLPKQFDV